MAEPDATTLLIRLIDTAERVLNRNALLEPEFDTLASAIAAHRVAPGHIIKDEATMLVTALRRVDMSRDNLPWRMVAGALLPMVRAALGRAIEERHAIASRPDAEAQPDYGRRR